MNPDDLLSPPVNVNDVPPGIPPELWAGQYVDRYVETGAAYPGASAIHLDLPRRYARDWRLICSAVTNAIANGGADPLLEQNQGGVFPILNGPSVFPSLAVPALPAPAIDWLPAVMVMQLGSDRVFVDYPGRGACYQLSAHKLDVMVFFRTTVATTHSAGRYHLVLQPTYLPCAWNTPTFTTSYTAVPNTVGAYLNGAVPPRAVRCRFAPNDDTSSAVPMPAPVPPNCSVLWYTTSGSLIECWTINPNLPGQLPPWLFDAWPVPTRAAFVQIVRNGGGGTWIGPSLIWELSL